ncbi:MAG: pentapeptide repeat-containing protein [Gemmatimonadetes bacterium]|nr:pentapeptide repeat-containing protein [Gemmatimonadota bacterium]
MISRFWTWFFRSQTLQFFLLFLLVLAFGAFVGVLFSECAEKYISELLGLSDKNEALKFLGISMGGILVALQALMSYRRAKAMEETAKSQARATEEQANANKNTEQGQRQERLKNAIEHLGHEKDSVRLGGAYELFHLAKDIKELRQTVLDILCAHIRQTTGESKYRETHSSKPSEEVQSLLTLLFVQEHEVFKGCHINLQGSWLNGASLSRARLVKATLSKAQLQGVGLDEVQLQGADLDKTQLQGALLFKARLQGANLDKAQLQGAFLFETQLQEAFLLEAELQGVVSSLYGFSFISFENLRS